jgi:hypothetical protein
MKYYCYKWFDKPVLFPSSFDGRTELKRDRYAIGLEDDKVYYIDATSSCELKSSNVKDVKEFVKTECWVEVTKEEMLEMFNNLKTEKN